MHITPQLISQFTGLICEGDSLEDDLGDKEAIQETITKYACKKGSRYYDISDIKDPMMKMAAHLEGDKILFSNVLLTIVFSKIGVPDASKKFVWEYPTEDPSPVKRFE
ncbi:hypothetical protein KI387_043676, partial [Taxus chinensis]